MLEERLLDLDREMFEIKEQQRLRCGLNIPLGEESRQFLLNYDERRLQIQANLDVATEDTTYAQNARRKPFLGVVRGKIKLVIYFSLVELRNISEKDKDPLRVSEFEDNSPFFEPNNVQSVNPTDFVNK
ncbi:hypothetical protein V8E54_005377 [Elaphomyces granulatus]